MMRVNTILGRAVGGSGYGTAKDGWDPGGSSATWVSDPPNGTFILTRPFTAQPLASRIGPRFRCRNFSQAINMDGPETRRSKPAKARQTCQNGSFRIPAR